jgi:hypothetical protein
MTKELKNQDLVYNKKKWKEYMKQLNSSQAIIWMQRIKWEDCSINWIYKGREMPIKSGNNSNKFVIKRNYKKNKMEW